jgi:hypothetical protein
VSYAAWFMLGILIGLLIAYALYVYDEHARGRR